MVSMEGNWEVEARPVRRPDITPWSVGRERLVEVERGGGGGGTVAEEEEAGAGDGGDGPVEGAAVERHGGRSNQSKRCRSREASIKSSSDSSIARTAAPQATLYTSTTLLL